MVAMTHQNTVSMVAAPVDVVERQLRDVPSWPQFMVGVSQVRQTSFGRYVFDLSDGVKTRSAQIAVTAHPREHRIVWHALAGPRFSGEFRLSAVDSGHTRVALTLTVDPSGFLSGLTDFISTKDATSTATRDLQQLEAMVVSSRARLASGS
jgi:uncharacterized membrane protein